MESVIVPAPLLDFINEGKKFIVAGHKEPDGDCVGSQLALALFLERLGKTAVPCSPGPFKRTELLSYRDRFLPFPSFQELKDYRVLLLDCSGPDRCGDMEKLLKGLPMAIIDHHATDDSLGLPENCSADYGPADYRDSKFPSVTLMIFKLIEAFGESPNKEEAELLFFGLCTDSGFFRHLSTNSGEVFRIAANLVDAGANPQQAYRVIHGGKSLGSRLLLGRVLARTESLFDGRLLLSCEKYEETQRFGSEGRDSDLQYQALQSVAGVEAIVIIRQESPEQCTLGLRSTDRINVSHIAKKFGGGGHKNAAGLAIQGKIDEIRPLIIEEFRKVFLENT